jgi:hypothetical protein
MELIHVYHVRPLVEKYVEVKVFAMMELKVPVIVYVM